jgi:hypothetical protein
MAVKDTELNEKIMAAFSSYNNGNYSNEKMSPQHLKILGDTMKDYLEEKTVVTYGWAAALPPPASTPDPVTSFKSEAEFDKFDLTSASDLITLAALIQAAVIAGKINHAEGFEVKTGSFLAVKPLVLSQQKTLPEAFYNCITKPTCAWYLTCINPAPLAGTHGPYTGATTGMVIA